MKNKEKISCKKVKKDKKKNVKVMHAAGGFDRFRWAFQTLILSISLSIVFGLLSQTLLSSLGVVMASIGICFFIVISVIFDMFGIAVASADENFFVKLQEEGVIGGQTGLRLCQNSEKVCSFCADVVGDICSTLCGAAGACIVVTLTRSLQSSTAILLISTLVSSVIAGVTIFFKALMKEYAITRANKIILKVSKAMEKKHDKGQ